MPLRTHETILVFYNALPTYNPIKFKGEKQLKSTGGRTSNYGKFDYKPHYSEDYFPRSIIDLFPQIREEGQHPTQKSEELFRYLIKTYSNERDLVFDGYSGSGVTAAACIEENRKFICSENKQEYVDISQTRISNLL